MTRLSQLPPDDWVQVLSFTKGRERYVFMYDAASLDECLRRLGRFASDPELSFTWFDAAAISGKIRELERNEKAGRRVQR